MARAATTDSTSAEGSTLAQIVGRLAAVIDSEDYPTGDRAALRRLNLAAPASLSFYRFAFRHLPENWEAQRAAWTTIVAGIAQMCPHPHRTDRPMGVALAEAGYSEARLERLLAAEGELLHTLLSRAVRFLAAKNESANWTDFARLLLITDFQRREDVRLRIARHFYRNLKQSQKE